LWQNRKNVKQTRFYCLRLTFVPNFIKDKQKCGRKSAYSAGNKYTGLADNKIYTSRK